MLLRHGADPDLEVDGSENLRDVIAANIDNFDFAAYADKVGEWESDGGGAGVTEEPTFSTFFR